MITNMYYIKVHIQDALEDSKEVLRGGKSKYIQDNTEKLKRKKMSKGTNNDLQNTTQKTKDYVTPTPLKSCGTLMCSGRVNSSNCSTNVTRHDTLHIYAYICILYNDFSLLSFSI